MQYIHLFSVGLLLTLAAPMGAQQGPPKSWVDPDTGHRIVRLTDEPGSASLYFNQNAYSIICSPTGWKLVLRGRRGSGPGGADSRWGVALFVPARGQGE